MILVSNCGRKGGIIMCICNNDWHSSLEQTKNQSFLTGPTSFCEGKLQHIASVPQFLFEIRWPPALRWQLFYCVLKIVLVFETLSTQEQWTALCSNGNCILGVPKWYFPKPSFIVRKSFIFFVFMGTAKTIMISYESILFHSSTSCKNYQSINDWHLCIIYPMIGTIFPPAVSW